MTVATVKTTVARETLGLPPIEAAGSARIEHVAIDDVLEILGATLELVREGVCVVDQRGHLVMINAKAVRLFGGEARELLDQPFARFVAFEDREPAAADTDGGDLRHAENSRAGMRCAFMLRRLDGRTIAVTGARRSVSMGTHGEGAVFVFDDEPASDGHHRGAEPAMVPGRCGPHDPSRETASANEGDERERQLSWHVLAKISHELRTPLHAIMGFASLAVEKWEQASPETLFRYVGLIRESGERLVRLINALLDFAKLQAGAMPLRFQETELRRLVEQVLEQSESLWKEKGLSVHWIESPQDTRIACDVDRMAQVLWNVLANAIKFSPRDGRLSVSIVHDTVPAGRREDDHVRLPAMRVTIRDEGPGIPPAECARIFDPFVQASNAQRHSGGTGLGLAICREIVQAHGGTIAAGNHEAGGAAIAIVLPRRPPVWLRERHRARAGESDHA